MITLNCITLARQAVCALLAFAAIASSMAHGDEFSLVRGLVEQKCLKCHGGEEVNAEIDFSQVTSRRQFLDRAELIGQMIDAVEANTMPPESEPALSEESRVHLLSSLKVLLREAISNEAVAQLPIRRLNRFQYNNAVKDLFRLKLDIFPLPEKLMTRQSNYVQQRATEMPPRVNVASHALDPQPGLRGVKTFPKDLRATHGFDNQANELTLSPLLLEAFLHLSVSIVESPDFNQDNVGIWNDFFLEPDANRNLPDEVRRRLRRFLTLAFRRPVDGATLDRYTAYVLQKSGEGLSFADSMKKVASAALSSPSFLFQVTTPDAQDDEFELASRLSFFLWSSGPDEGLLQLAERAELSRPEVLKKTIDRMLADPRIERFLDTFPVQWMQLENALAVTPDPELNRYFRLDEQRPASLQMVLEPLLLFDTVFVEDRSILELIKPAFSYRSEFLTTWYTSDLKPKAVDVDSLVAENRRLDQRRKELQTRLDSSRKDFEALRTSVRNRLLAARAKELGESQPVDLKPYAAWEFDGDLKDSIRSLDLMPNGKIRFENGMVALDRSYLISGKLPISLAAKSLEVWCQVDNLDQRGGGVMGIQGPGDLFDTIVLGERKPRQWISGSNRFARTEDFPNATAETKTSEMLHLVMVYAADGTTMLYRDGKPYGRPYRKGSMKFPKDQSSVIFGLRHLPPGGNKFLAVKIDKARLYDRALTAEEVAASASGGSYIADEELLAGMTSDERKQHDTDAKTVATTAAELKAVPPNKDPVEAQREAQQRFDDQLRRLMQSVNFERVELADPRYGGVITNAAMLSMTSGPKRTHPIARGAWIIEVILNDPPPPPPNDVPPLNEGADDKHQTIRERFAAHRNNPSCAGCHSRLGPLGFALENFDITGRWRDKYPNGREVDASGTLLRKHKFETIEQFKDSLCKEDRQFAKAFTRHLLRFALSRELGPSDVIAIDSIVENAAKDDFKLQSLIRAVVQSNSFLASQR